MRFPLLSLLVVCSTSSGTIAAGDSNVDAISNNLRAIDIDDQQDIEEPLVIDWDLWRSEFNTTMEQNNWNRHLVDDYVRPNDICINARRRQIPCSQAKALFPRCRRGIELCYNRTPSKRNFYDDGKEFPLFYIDVTMVKCAPEIGWNCDRCDNPAIMCRKYGEHGRCMHRPTYIEHCEDKSASQIRQKRRRRERKRREEMRKKRKAARKKRAQVRARTEQQRTANRRRNGNRL